MEQAKSWRLSAKVVAYLDMLFWIAKLSYVIWWIFFTDELDKSWNGHNERISDAAGIPFDPNSEDNKNTLLVIKCSGAGLVAIFSLIFLCVAIRLKMGTDIGRHPVEAHRFCNTWYIVSIILVILSLIGGLIGGQYIWMAIDVVPRIIFLIIVHIFKRELRFSFSPPVRYPATAPMTGFTVGK